MSALVEITDTANNGPPALLGVDQGWVIEIGGDDAYPARVFIGQDLFEPSCAVVLPEQGSTGLDEHPFGAYNIAYPYCRTAIRIAVDDPDPSPLMAQVTSFARYLSMRVVGMVCGLPAPLAVFRVQDSFPVADETGLQSCAVFSVIHPKTRHGFLIVDGTKIPLPLQVLLQIITSDGSERLGWINVLPPGWTEE